jgi:signal transduction histidine kinase
MFLYNLKSKEGSFYYMSNNVMQDLELKNIIGIILPSIIVVEIVAICIAFGIGLISSRKIAVPIFKIEKWASRLKAGKLNTTLAFREKDQLNELTTQCNGVTDFYKTVFHEIRQHTENIASKPDDPTNVANETKALQQLLHRIEM